MKTLSKNSLSILLQSVQAASRSFYLFFSILCSLFLAPIAYAVVDANNNGMSDVWERHYHGGELFTNLDPQADLDGDGYSNHDESLAGTDPANGTPPDGFLIARITHAPAVYSTPEGGGDPVLETSEGFFVAFHSLVGKQYTILFSPDLSEGSWSPAQDPVIGTGEDLQMPAAPTYTDGTMVPAGFWRVAVTDTDTDGDGLTDAEENQLGTNPQSADTDADGLPDAWEIDHGFNPNDDGSINVNNGAAGDPDGDGLSNLDEYWFLTAPHLWDTDADGLNDWDELFVYSTYPGNPDSDGDDLNDYLEVITYGTNPFMWDTDKDTLSDGEEIFSYTTNPLKIDSDGDWMSDDYEIDNYLDTTDAADGLLDADSDTLPNRLEFVFMDQGYDPFVANDASLFPWTEDPDKDGLTTRQEFDGPAPVVTGAMYLQAASTTASTHPRRPDTDGDGMPDGWEVEHNLNSNDATGDNGTAGDPDGDGLSNFDEWLNATDPNDADSDDDLTNDGLEVAQGSDPNDPGDGGDPPPAAQMLDVPFTVSDPSGSHSEKWKLTITGLGPDDHRSFSLASPGYGQPATKTFKLRKWNRYETSISHLGTDPEYLEQNDHKPDYDWEATVDGKPTSESMEHTEEQTGVNNFFMAKGHWLVDNRQPVFTTEKHGDDEDIVSGKKATLVPVDIDDNTFATGVDDVFITADEGSGGYQDKFWIMAPAGGPTDEMRFRIPLNPAINLEITSDHATPTPATTSLSDADPGPIVGWAGTGAETIDNITVFKIGTAPEEEIVELPILVKTMKKRTVKVALHPVASVIAGKADNTPDLLPTKAQLEAKLNRIFRDQINVTFDVTPLTVEPIAFDVATATSNPPFTFNSTTTPIPRPAPTAGDGIILFRNWLTPEAGLIVANRPGDYDIHVFVVGGGSPIYCYQVGQNLGMDFESAALGLTNVEAGANYCIVDGDRDAKSYNLNGVPIGPSLLPGQRTLDHVIWTICHEIGHVMLGAGHPDESDNPTYGGVAPLPGTDRTKRLMCSGPNANLNSILLVKSEWDKAEEWLKNRPKGDR